MSGRTRLLHPDFFIDTELSGLGFGARLLFAGLWCFADREGRLENDPKKLAVQIIPYDIQQGKIRIEKLLEELTPQFITKYQANGKNYLQIKNFLKYQRPHPHEKKSMIPPPKNLRNVIT